MWLSRTGRRVQFGATLADFQEAVRRAFDLRRCMFELYRRFPSDSCVIEERIKLDTKKRYSKFRRLLRTEEAPVAWLYLVPGGSKVRAWSSPQAGPAAVDTAQDSSTPAAPSTASAASDVISVASSGECTGPQQAEFRLQLYRRNGKKWECAACGAQDTGGGRGIQAAHIVPHGASEEEELPSGMYSTWDIGNGMLLCELCH